MKEKLSVKEMFVLGGALFAMHFGASCMLYPVTWGKDAGTTLPLMYIGIFLSSIVLPFLGYLALVKGKGNYLEITRRVSPKFGLFFVALTILVMGPVYIVPRMSAAAWSATLQLTGLSFESPIPIILFNIVYYLVTYWFVCSSEKVVNRIGNILFPVLIAIVIAVIVKSIVTPISTTWTPASFDQNPVLYGFLQGYATGDMQCSLMFGLVVVQGIRSAGIAERAINKNLMIVGVVGLGMLALTHLGHMVAGANLGGTIDLTLSALYTQMVLQLWGRVGGIFFNVALVAAALTTAIGCVSSTAEIWVEMLGGKLSYRLVCIISCAASCAVSIAGLDTIVTVLGPVLDACYPAAIVLAVYYCFCKNMLSRRNLFAAKCAVISAAVMGGLHMICVYIDLFALKADGFIKAYSMLPLSEYNLAWLPITVIVYLIAYLSAGKMTGDVAMDESAIT